MVMLKRTGRRRSSTAVTIRTVAEQAGVSLMTVSNVVNGTGKVSDQTRARVRQAIRNVGKKQRCTLAEAIAAVPESESRVILATGSYIGEGFDDARLDTLFLAMPISWKGTLQQYVGRLHRLHDAKRVVRVYDYVDSQVLMLARMYARRLNGYGAIGYRIGAAVAEMSPVLHRYIPDQTSL